MGTVARFRDNQTQQPFSREEKAKLAQTISPEVVLDGRPGACLIKKGRPDDPEALVREYEFIASLPAELKWAFPRVWGLQTEGDTAQYRMDKVPLPTLAEAILGSPGKNLPSKLDAERALDHLRPILNFVVHDLHPSKVSPMTPDFLDRAVFQKYENAQADRLAFIQTKLAAKNGVDREERSCLADYRALLEAGEVMVDGMMCENAAAILQRIKASPSLCKMLTPPRLYHVHGDLSFNNVLINVEDVANFTLIDPKPLLGGGDMAKDFASLLFPCQGGFALFTRDYFDVEVDREGGLLRVEIDLWGNEPKAVLRKYAEGKGSGGVFEEVQILDGTERGALDEISQQLPTLIREILNGSQAEEDDTWLMRAELHQAVSLCSLLLAHLEESPECAVACHAMGLKLLTQWWEKYSDLR